MSPLLPRITCAAMLWSGGVMYPNTPHPAEAKKQLLITDTSPEAMARASYQRFNDAAMKRAIKAQAAIEGDHQASLRPGYPDNVSDRVYFIREAIEIAKARYGLTDWQGGGAERAARMTLYGLINASGGHPLVGGPTGASGPLLEDGIKGITYRLDQNNALFRQDTFSTEGVYQRNLAINTLAAQRPDVFGQFEEEFKDPGFDTPAARDPEARHELELMNIKDSVAAQRKIMSEFTDDQRRLRAMVNALRRNNTPEAYQLVKNEAMRQMRTNAEQTARDIGEMRAWMNEQREQERKFIRGQNISGPFYALSQIAQLGGDHQAAAILAKFGRLTDTVYQLSTLTTSFAKQPYLYVNLYLAAATTAVDLFQKSQGRSEMTQIMDGLRQIAEQIEALRQEMHKRFDALDLRMGVYFHYTFVDLDQIQKSQESLKKATSNLQSDLAELSRRQDEKFEQLTRTQLRDLLARCMPIDENGKPVRVDDPGQVNTCVSNFSAISAGSLSQLIGVPRFSMRAYEGLVAQVNPEIERPLLLANPPATYLYGTDRLANFLKTNPKGLGVARFGAESDDAPNSINKLIGDGRALDDFLKQMATRATEAGTSLRTSTVVKLIQLYRQVAATLAQGVQTEHVAAFSSKVPELARKWAAAPAPVSRETQPLSQALVNMCPGVPYRVLSTNEESRDHRAGPVIDARNQRIGTFQGDLPLNPGFVDLLPPSLKWTGYGGDQVLQNFKFGVCFRRADVNGWSYAFDAHTTVNATFEVELTASYVVGGQPRSAVVGTFVGNVNQHGPWNDLAWSKNLSTLIWSSPVGEGSPRPLITSPLAEQLKSYGIAGTPSQYFKFVPGPGLPQLEQDYGQALDAKKPVLADRTLSTFDRQVRDLNEIRWQMAYLLTEGLDMSDERARSLYESLLGDVMVEAGVLVRDMVDKSPEHILERLNKKIEEIAKTIEALGKVHDLKPAHSRLEPYIRILEGLQEKSQ